MNRLLLTPEMDEWMDGCWMDEWTDGQMDGWMDGPPHTFVAPPLPPQHHVTTGSVTTNQI